MGKVCLLHITQAHIEISRLMTFAVTNNIMRAKTVTTTFAYVFKTVIHDILCLFLSPKSQERVVTKSDRQQQSVRKSMHVFARTCLQHDELALRWQFLSP